MSKYTVVQHSAWAVSQNPQFEHGLEEAALGTPAQEWLVTDAGGLLFDSYAEAEAYVDAEPYPPGYKGLVPQAPGTFDEKVRFGGRPLYIPVRGAEPEGDGG